MRIASFIQRLIAHHEGKVQFVGTKDTPIELELEKAFQARSNLHGALMKPLWVKQFPIRSYKADFAFPEVKLVVEADGEFWHGRPKAKAHDDRRDSVMADDGWIVLRYPGWQIFRDAPRIAYRVEKIVHALRVRERIPQPH